MLEPEPELAPETPPAIVPIVQEKVLAMLDVKAMLGPDPLQIVAEEELVTEGDGFTVTVIG